MAPRRRTAAASYGFFGGFVLLSAVVSGSDRLGTIDLPFRRAAEESYSVETLSPMAPRRRAAEASYGFFGCFVAVCGGLRFRSIGDNRSTISTHEKSVPGTEPRGADRPEAYPTGHEKSELALN